MHVPTKSLNKSILRVFLSSPGDLGAQRDVARQVVSALNADPLLSPIFVIEVVGWDTRGARVPLSANVTPQAAVNEYLPRPRDCDLTVVLLWSRLGTPLPIEWADGDDAARASGTVWELEDARSAGKPVWIYRRTGAPQVSLDDPDMAVKKAQLEAVNRFVGTQRASDGSLLFGLHTFDDDEQLRDLLTEHFRHFIGKRVHGAAVLPTVAIGEPPECLPSSAIVQAAVAAAAAASALEPTTVATGPSPVLHPLEDYPVGPMIKDVVVGELALAVAELTEAIHPRSTLARINESLASAAETGVAPVRLVHAMFPSTLGSRFFWEEVLHWAAVQGPRVLAATLAVVDQRRLEGQALAEYTKLVGRLNRYV